MRLLNLFSSKIKIRVLNPDWKVITEYYSKLTPRLNDLFLYDGEYYVVVRVIHDPNFSKLVTIVIEKYVK